MIPGKRLGDMAPCRFRNIQSDFDDMAIGIRQVECVHDCMIHALAGGKPEMPAALVQCAQVFPGRDIETDMGHSAAAIVSIAAVVEQCQLMSEATAGVEVHARPLADPRQPQYLAIEMVGYFKIAYAQCEVVDAIDIHDIGFLFSSSWKRLR